MKIKRTIAYIASVSLFLSSCVTLGGELSDIGPKLSSLFNQPSEYQNIVAQDGLKLDVTVPVFDPGLPENPTDDEKTTIWPELRRAESTKFSLMMKRALESTEAFGAVRVAPNQNSTGDLYVLGKINESTGEDIEINVKVVDISGNTWLDTTFAHQVSEKFHQNLRNEGKDPYEPVFDEAAKKIVERLKGRSGKERTSLRSITKLRFAASFSESEFSKYLGKKEGFFGGTHLALLNMPADEDPKFMKTKAIRVRDQLFIDNLQTHYQKFESKMNESYAVWQKQSLQEAKALREAKMKATGEAVAGILVILGAVALAAAGASNNTSYNYDPTPGLIGAAGGAIGGALLADSFRTSKEAEVYRDALSELGQSIDLELAPQVIKFEEETVKLTGDAAEQFAQWRNFLKEIYQAEATPERRL